MVVVLFELHGGGVEHSEVVFVATIKSPKQEDIDPNQGGRVILPLILDLPEVAVLLRLILPIPLGWVIVEVQGPDGPLLILRPAHHEEDITWEEGHGVAGVAFLLTHGDWLGQFDPVLGI